MRRIVTLFIGLVVLALAISAAGRFQSAGSQVMAQTTNPGSSGQITSPQVVAGGGFTSEIILLNTAVTTCNAGILYHQGAGNFPDQILLTNGQNLGNAFTTQIPGQGTTSLVITTQDAQFVGAVTVDPIDPFCSGQIKVQTQFKIRNQQGQLFELFSFPTPQPIRVGTCASAPVNFDPDAADGAINDPGVSSVSLNPLNNVQRCMDLRDSQGNQITDTICDSFDGTHSPGLLSQFFPGQGAFSGTWRVCYAGTPSAQLVDTLFIDVVQEPPVIQFDSNEHALENPACTPGDTNLCLDDNRFKVQVDWRNSLSQPLQPAKVALVDSDDSGFFFFFNPDNTELLVKIFDGCRINNHFWVFYGATTNVEYTITVTDTQTNESRNFRNELGQAADAVTDTSAFATCP